jgi:hypothetical protein
MQVLGQRSDCKPSFSNDKIIYFSLESVLVYDFDFKLLKTINLERKILNCKISKNGIIAVVVKDSVVLYRDYEEYAVISAENVIGLDWNPKSDEELLIYTASEFMVFSYHISPSSIRSISTDNLLYKPKTPEWNCIFKIDIPYTPSKVEYSPCSRFIAISGDENKMMVWYKVAPALRSVKNTGIFKDAVVYDYVFLNHSTPVYNFEWRDIVQIDSPDVSPRACLLTISNDNIGRLWSSCDSGFGFANFDLAGVIEPTNQTEKVSCIHWLTGNALNQCVEVYSHVKNFKGKFYRNHA